MPTSRIPAEVVYSNEKEFFDHRNSLASAPHRDPEIRALVGRLFESSEDEHKLQVALRERLDPILSTIPTAARDVEKVSEEALTTLGKQLQQLLISSKSRAKNLESLLKELEL